MCVDEGALVPRDPADAVALYIVFLSDSIVWSRLQLNERRPCSVSK